MTGNETGFTLVSSWKWKKQDTSGQNGNNLGKKVSITGVPGPTYAQMASHLPRPLPVTAYVAATMIGSQVEAATTAHEL